MVDNRVLKQAARARTGASAWLRADARSIAARRALNAAAAASARFVPAVVEEVSSNAVVNT